MGGGGEYGRNQGCTSGVKAVVWYISLYPVNNYKAFYLPFTLTVTLDNKMQAAHYIKVPHVARELLYSTHILHTYTHTHTLTSTH